MERDGRADVPGNAIEAVANSVFVAATRFNNEMFFAVSDRLRIFQIKQDHSRVRHFRTNSLVTEVEAKAVWSRLADDPRQQQRGGFE